MYGHNEVPERSFLKRSARLGGIALLALGLSLSTSADDDDDDDDNHRGHRQSYQTANIVDFHTGDELAGAATLWRSRNSVIANVHASELDPNSAYSVWWVVWNKPSRCGNDGCGEEDIGARGNGVFYAGGFVTGADGTANITMMLQAGPPADGVQVLLGGGLDRGKGFKAEIHLVIRSHGPILAGMADVQVGSFDGACEVNVCEDQQAAVFPP